MEQWFSKSVIQKNIDIHKDLARMPTPVDMTISYRKSVNDEVYTILQGSKNSINKYLELADSANQLLSERYRKLSNLPKYHFYNSKVERVQ